MNTQQDHLSIEKQIISSLKDFRKNKKMTQTQLANRIGVSRDTIARIESGKARIYLAQVVAIADALDVMLQDLLMQDVQKEEMITMNENMSVSQPNVHITYKIKLLPSQSLKTRGLSTVGEPANEGGRSPSIESPPHRRGDVETTVGDIKYSASSLSPNPNQPSLPPVGRRRSVVGKLQRRQATNPYLNQPAVEIYGESMKDYILNHRLFWHWVPEDKLTGLSISSVVEATLDQGNEKDISDMFKMIGVEKAADVFKHGISGFRTNYREDTIAYFSNYFKRHVPEYSN